MDYKINFVLRGRSNCSFFETIGSFSTVVMILLVTLSLVLSAGVAFAEGRQDSILGSGRALVSASKIAYRSPADIEAFFVKNKIPREYLSTTTTGADAVANNDAVRRTGTSDAKIGKANTRGIIYYRLDYMIPAAAGAGTLSSGILALPAGTRPGCGIRLVSYQHGTLFDDRDAPSRLDSCPEAEAVASVFAARGFAVAMADYRGLGTYHGFHPYFHAESVAADCDAFLKATAEFMAALGLRPAGEKVYLAGFSQGGHATLALQRRLETPGGSECGLAPAANAVIGGACDPYLLLRSWTIKPNPLSGAVAGRIITSYGRVYSSERGAIDGAFKPPYAAMMKDIAGNGFTADKIMKLPASPRALFSDEFLAGISSPRGEYSKILISNETYRRWRPAAPVIFYHGGADNIVPPLFSKIACRSVKMNGGDAGFVVTGEGLDHAGSIIPSCAAAAEWFGSVK